MVVDFLVELVLDGVIHLVFGLFELAWSGLVHLYELFYVKVLKRL